MINTEYFSKCIITLQKAIDLLGKSDPNSIEFELYRSACIKEFEIILEQAGKLLRKYIKPFLAIEADADKLYYKDVFRTAAKFRIISITLAENWLSYRDIRNKTAHDYDVNFAEETLTILPSFINDCQELLNHFNQINNNNL